MRILVIVILIIFAIYLFYPSQSEPFVAISGMNPLTTYDSVGTSEFLFHTNDLPYYDPTFYQQTDAVEASGLYSACHPARDFIPSNFASDPQFAGVEENQRVINPNRPSRIAPFQPENIY